MTNENKNNFENQLETNTSFEKARDSALKQLNASERHMNELISTFSSRFEDSGAIRQKIQNAYGGRKIIHEVKTKAGTRWQINALNTYDASGEEKNLPCRLPGTIFQLATISPAATIGQERVAVQAHIDDGMERVYLECLKALPFSYDLYLTCDLSCDPRKLCLLYSDNSRVHDVCVMQLPEHVHSLAGLFVSYRDILKSHRLLLHFGSSKPSCNILECYPRDLCGDERTIRTIAELLLMRDDIALVFPESFSQIASADELFKGNSEREKWFQKHYARQCFSYPMGDNFWLATDHMPCLASFSDSYEAYPEGVETADKYGKKLAAEILMDNCHLLDFSYAHYRVCCDLSYDSFEHCGGELIQTLKKEAEDADILYFDADGALLNIRPDGKSVAPRREMIKFFSDELNKGKKKLYVRNNTIFSDSELLTILSKKGLSVTDGSIISEPPKDNGKDALYIGTKDCANAQKDLLRKEENSTFTGKQKKEHLRYYPIPSYEMQILFSGLSVFFRNCNNGQVFVLAGEVLFNSPYSLNPLTFVRPEIQMLFRRYWRALSSAYLLEQSENLLADQSTVLVIDSSEKKLLRAEQLMWKDRDGRSISIHAGRLRRIGLLAVENKEKFFRELLKDIDWIGTLGSFLQYWFDWIPAEKAAADYPVLLPERTEEMISILLLYTDILSKEGERDYSSLQEQFCSYKKIVYAGTTTDSAVRMGLFVVSHGETVFFAGEKADKGTLTVPREPGGIDTPEEDKKKGDKKEDSGKERKDSDTSAEEIFRKKKKFSEEDARVLTFEEYLDRIENSGTPVTPTDLLRMKDCEAMFEAHENVWLHEETGISYNHWYQMIRPTAKELQKQRETVFALQPKISIVIPAFRTSEKMLRMLLDSILKQTYSNLEVCVADASDYKHMPKESRRGRLPKDVLAEYAEKDPRVKFIVLDTNAGISENTNEAIRIATGDIIAFADHDDEITPDAFYEIVKAYNEQPWIQMFYSDEDKIDEYSKYFYMAHFKPDFSRDYLECSNYICHLMAFKRSLLDEIAVRDDAGVLHYELKEYDGSQDHDLVLRASERALEMEAEDIRSLEEGKPAREGGLTNLVLYHELLSQGRYTSLYIHHIPKVLYHWRIYALSTAANMDAKPYTSIAGEKAVKAHLDRIGVRCREVDDGFSPGIYHPIFEHNNPLVSVIIPNKDHTKDLDKAIRSVMKGHYTNLEFLIIENNSTEEATEKYYKMIQKEFNNVRVIRYNGGFNYSKINNFGVTFAEGEYLLFLNNDTEMIGKYSIDEMVGLCQRKDIGAVGAKLLYPDGTYQHAGVVLGITEVAGHCFLGEFPGTTYYNRAEFRINYSAVTAACMMSKKSAFEEVGGFAEEFAVAFNDVDYCMKLRTKGMHIVYNGYATFHHFESKSRGLDLDSSAGSEKEQRFHHEIRLFVTKWRDILRNGDPYYNPNFTLMKQDFSLRDLSTESIGKPYYSLLTDDIISGNAKEPESVS